MCSSVQPAVPQLRRLQPLWSADIASLAVDAAAAAEGRNESSVAIASPNDRIAEFADRERIIHESVQQLKSSLLKSEVATDGNY